ncbi:MAG: DUF6600 domain-containing protein, partial [Hyphomicrobium sp.]
YEALDEGGRWITHARYGEVWQPNVDEGWRPYTLGRWAFSADYGWTWVSDEPFGWAVYHYGRWTFDGGDGWMWVPGTEWGPAWVAWRNSDDVIGWAPLPPSARFTGGRMSVDASAMEGDRFEHGWVFVRPRYFARPEMRRYVRPPSWNADLVVRTTPRLGYERGSRGVMNRGLAPEEVERLASRPVPRVKIAPVDEPGLRRPDRFDDWRGKRAGEVKIYRPGHKRTVETMKKSRRANSDNGERDRSRDNGERDRSRDNGERDRSRDNSESDRSHDKSERRNAAAPALPPGVNPGGRKPAGAAANPAPSNAPGKGVPAFAPRPPTSAASEDAPASAPPKNSAPSSAKSYGEPYEKNYGEARDTPSTTPSAARSSGTDTSSTGKSGDTPPDSRTGERRRSEVTRSQSVRSESTANSKTSDGGATTGTIEQPATKGKKRWDGSGTSGAPSPSGASPEVDQQ